MELSYSEYSVNKREAAFSPSGSDPHHYANILYKFVGQPEN